MLLLRPLLLRSLVHRPRPRLFATEAGRESPASFTHPLEAATLPLAPNTPSPAIPATLMPSVSRGVLALLEPASAWLGWHLYHARRTLLTLRTRGALRVHVAAFFPYLRGSILGKEKEALLQMKLASDSTFVYGYKDKLSLEMMYGNNPEYERKLTLKWWYFSKDYYVTPANMHQVYTEVTDTILNITNEKLAIMVVARLKDNPDTNKTSFEEPHEWSIVPLTFEPEVKPRTSVAIRTWAGNHDKQYVHRGYTD